MYLGMYVLWQGIRLNTLNPMFSHTITLHQCLYIGLDQYTVTTLVITEGCWCEIALLTCKIVDYHQLGLLANSPNQVVRVDPYTINWGSVVESYKVQWLPQWKYKIQMYNFTQNNNEKKSSCILCEIRHWWACAIFYLFIYFYVFGNTNGT